MIKTTNVFDWAIELVNFLKENPEIKKEIENKILLNAGIVEKAMMEGEVKNKESKTKEE